MILIKSKKVLVPDSIRDKVPGIRGKPESAWVADRTGPLCTLAFAMQDQKSQGNQFSEVFLNLKGVHRIIPTRPSFIKSYVQLSRAKRWEGLYLFRTPARSDFMEPQNVLDSDMRDAVPKLKRLGDRTIQHFVQSHKQSTWFCDWEVRLRAILTIKDGD